MTQLFSMVFADPIGRWFLYFGAFVVVCVLGLGVVKSVRSKLEELSSTLGVVRDNVANDHPTNMREEADGRHDETSGKLDLLVTLVQGQGSSIASLQTATQNLYKLIVGNTSDIENLQEALEHTHTREQINQLIKENSHVGQHTKP